MAPETPTCVARLTPAGRGAVATLAVWGPQAATWIAERFRPHGKWSLVDRAAAAPSVGTWPVGDSREEIVLRQTSAQAFELHCHGGMASVQAVVAGLTAAGAQPADWNAWLASVTPDGRLAAWQALATVTAERPAAVLLDQISGAWERELAEIAALRASDPAAARSRLTALCERASLGLRLTRPFRVVLCGQPNVGKSSLINALLGYSRAIAAAEPGTTRDVVAAPTACGGWPVELSDTAGLRDAADPLEAEGIERARQQIAAAELLLWVIDASAAEPGGDGERPAELAAAVAPLLIVANKCDLPVRRALPAAAWRVSAATGAGIEELTAAIAVQLVPHPPLPGSAVPLTPEQVGAVEAALAGLDGV